MSDTDVFLEGLRARCLAYREQVEELERSRKPGAGLLGLPGGVKDDPCHEVFAEDLSARLTEYAAAKPASADVSRVLRFLFREPLETSYPLSAGWMLMAVQGMARDLVPLLTPEDAAVLAAEYKKAYPRRMRFPTQQQLFKMLQSRAKGATV